jgi:hypothetical protein
MEMKLVLTTLGVISTLILTACTKTESATSTMATTHPPDLDVEIEVEDGEIIIMIDSEEQVFELSEIMSGVDFGNMSGEFQVHMIINGEEIDGLPEGMVTSVMKMMGGHGGPPEDMREMHEHMMQMQRDGEHRGEGRMRSREISEEEQFMRELGILGAVSEHLEHNEAVALMGIHMIRDELEGEMRMEALEEIIEGSDEGTAVRNAALIVAILTMQEEGDIEAATDLMVELVLSN